MKMNPIYKRECRVSARSFRLVLVLLIFNGILAMVALLNMYSALAQIRLTAEVQYTGFLDLYMFVSSLEFLMLILIMPALTAGSISGERERQTLDLMLTTCMTPADIVLGKLYTAMGTMFLMVISSLPILAMVFVYGGVTVSDLLLLVCCFFAAALLVGSIGLCCSALFRRTTAATVAAYAVTAVLTAGTYGINFLVTYFGQMHTGQYLAAADFGAVSGGSGSLLYILLINPIATFAQVIGRLTAGNQTWVQVGSWFGNQADNELIRHWLGVSMGLQAVLAVCCVWGAVRSVEKSKI